MEFLMIFAIVFGIFILIIIYSFYQDRKDSKELEEFSQKQKEYKRENGIPDNTDVFTYLVGGCSYLDQKIYENYNKEDDRSFLNVYVYKEMNNLILFSTNRNEPEPIKYVINIGDIISFFIRGEILSDTHIEGGGSSIGKAAVGGFIAGEAGAIVGSRNKINSYTIHRDERNIALLVKSGDATECLLFQAAGGMYETLLKLIPEKEESVVRNNCNQSESNLDAFSKIFKLADLKEKGVITEDEFLKKKEELLEKI
mgnify:CR=1 FL=1|jgi:uncharacterized membrane protein